MIFLKNHFNVLLCYLNSFQIAWIYFDVNGAQLTWFFNFFYFQPIPHKKFKMFAPIYYIFYDIPYVKCRGIVTTFWTGIVPLFYWPTVHCTDIVLANCTINFTSTMYNDCTETLFWWTSVKHSELNYNINILVNVK
jgi:hypothetical protein